ncbi:MAG: VIT1/CCC1 transporter family protein, partial [Dehalococcoidia bacterium]|nr:VIT1/CCC1 transporter family protein [Dehalococcoidia bacterium]
TIAVADAFADSLGIHISEESEGKHSNKEIWQSTISTFLSKFIFALTFIIPILLLPLTTAVIVSIVWGLSTLGILSFRIAREQGTKPWKVITEHMLIGLVVIAATHYIGEWIGKNLC